MVVSCTTPSPPHLAYMTDLYNTILHIPTACQTEGSPEHIYSADNWLVATAKRAHGLQVGGQSEKINAEHEEVGPKIHLWMRMWCAKPVGATHHGRLHNAQATEWREGLDRLGRGHPDLAGIYQPGNMTSDARKKKNAEQVAKGTGCSFKSRCATETAIPELAVLSCLVYWPTLQWSQTVRHGLV